VDELLLAHGGARAIVVLGRDETVVHRGIRDARLLRSMVRVRYDHRKESIWDRPRTAHLLEG
jgi:hypothetical protein